MARQDATLREDASRKTDGKTGSSVKDGSHGKTLTRKRTLLDAQEEARQDVECEGTRFHPRRGMKPFIAGISPFHPVPWPLASSSLALPH